MRTAYYLAGAALAAIAASIPALPAQAQDSSFTQLERGKYLVRAGNCQGCHTNPGDESFAGARAMQTPFGTIYTPNITFDTQTGLGLWTKDDFWQAMNRGIRRDGAELYPAFPYPHFTVMNREDVDAIYEYLSTLEPVRRAKPENELPFPLNQRIAVKGWKLLFFEPETFSYDETKSEEWNRGAFLVNGPGHCGGCHTPKNIFGADKDDEELTGGTLENWTAPDIRAGENGGLERWNKEDIVTFLKHGRNRFSAAYSTMAEVIGYSTQYMTEEDLGAIATYLQSLDSEARPDPDPADDSVLAAGGAIFKDSCSACHTHTGEGVDGMLADLTQSTKVSHDDPTTVLRIILEGAQAVTTESRPTNFGMPAYDWKLSDREIAAVATYIRQSWGNWGASVDDGEVADLREYLKHVQH